MVFSKFNESIVACVWRRHFLTTPFHLVVLGRPIPLLTEPFSCIVGIFERRFCTVQFYGPSRWSLLFLFWSHFAISFALWYSSNHPLVFIKLCIICAFLYVQYLRFDKSLWIVAKSVGFDAHSTVFTRFICAIWQNLYYFYGASTLLDTMYKLLSNLNECICNGR